MKVALELGEALEVAILQNDRVVGTLSMRLQGPSGGAARQQAAPVAAPAAVGRKRRGRKPGRKAGGRRRNISAEARAKMAEAQRRRWAKFRQDRGK